MFRLYNPVVKRSAVAVHLLGIPIAIFSLLGLLWVTPFPSLGFLGHYNGFINWASFFIAILVYYYLRLAPVVSYVLLLFLLLCAYGVTELVSYQTTNNLRVWVICLSLLLVAFTACVLTANNNSPVKAGNRLRLVLAAPIWEILWMGKKLQGKSTM